MFKKAGLGLAAISYDSADVLDDFANRKSITFPLLSDQDSRVIREYDVVDRKYDKPKAKVTVKSTDGWESFGTGAQSAIVPVYGLSDPAVFVLKPDRTIQWRFASEYETLRFTGASVLQHSLGITTDATRTDISGGKIPLVLTASNKAAGLGDRIELGIEMKIPPGLHVYGPNVTGGYRGTQWVMSPSACVATQQPVYPEAVLRRLDFSEEPLPIFEGTVRLNRELIIVPSVSDDDTVYKTFIANCVDAEGSLTVKATLGFQACDTKECFPPQAVPIEWKFDFSATDGTRVPSELWRVFSK